MRRARSSTVVVLVGVLGPSGCFPLFEFTSGPGALAIRDDDGALAIAVCRDIVVNEIIVWETRSLPDSREIPV